MHFVFSISGISVDACNTNASCSLLLTVGYGTNCTCSTQTQYVTVCCQLEKRYLCTFEEQTVTHPCKLQLEA